MKKKLLAVLLSALFVVILISHCSNNQNKETAKIIASNQIKCPVMGGQINKEVYIDFQGKRIYFCCSGCIETFNNNKDEHLKKLKEQGVVLENTPKD
jgi:YHS domain-containing protein